MSWLRRFITSPWLGYFTLRGWRPAGMDGWWGEETFFFFFRPAFAPRITGALHTDERRRGGRELYLTCTASEMAFGNFALLLLLLYLVFFFFVDFSFFFFVLAFGGAFWLRFVSSLSDMLMRERSGMLPTTPRLSPEHTHAQLETARVRGGGR